MAIADALTGLRLILAPFFIVAFVTGHSLIALVVFSIAGFTDLIDGTVARLFREHTKFGAMLDPIADKLLLQSCFGALTWTGYLPIWFFCLVLFRDLMIFSGVFYLRHIHATFTYRASSVSKLATLFQLLTAVVGLSIRGWQPFATTWGAWMLPLLTATALLIVISGTRYVLLGFRILEKNRT